LADLIDKSKKKAEKYSFKNSRKHGIMEGIQSNISFYSAEDLIKLKKEIEKIVSAGFDAS
jgi:hypothetical protein